MYYVICSYPLIYDYIRLDICKLIFPKYWFVCESWKPYSFMISRNHQIEFIPDAKTYKEMNIFVECLVYKSYVLTIYVCVPWEFQLKMTSWIPNFSQWSYKHRFLMTNQMLVDSPFQIINIYSIYILTFYYKNDVLSQNDPLNMI